MTTTITKETSKAAKILRQIAKKYIDDESCINISEAEDGVHIDGEVYDMYWGNDIWYDQQEEIQKAFDEASLFVEPYTSSILSVTKA